MRIREALAALMAQGVPGAGRVARAPREIHTNSLYVNAQLELRREMHRLWPENALWMRQVLIAELGDGLDAKDATDRLMKNQEDIGGAFAAHYGRADRRPQGRAPR
jgi:hypothetical protein